MNTQIISPDGYQHFIMSGCKSFDTSSDYRSVSIQHSFKPRITDFREIRDDMVTLKIEELSLNYFNRSKADDNIREAKLDSRLKRFCYIHKNDQGDVKTLYLAPGCVLPDVTHACLGIASRDSFPIKIANLSPSEEKKLLKYLEKELKPGAECVLF